VDDKDTSWVDWFKDSFSAQVSDDEIERLIGQAREEALSELRVILKDLMVEALLKQALREVEGLQGDATSAANGDLNVSELGDQAGVAPLAPNRAPRDGSRAGDREDDGCGEEALQWEIEALERKIAENEQLLKGCESRPVEGKEIRDVPDGQNMPRGQQSLEHGHYVYGIVRSNGDGTVEGLPEGGIDPNHPVHAIPYGETQAIVSKVPLSEFGQEPLGVNLGDVGWVERKVLAHQRVLENVVKRHSLVPMRFCTIYYSEDALRKMLACYHGDFVGALAQVEGKQEWGVKIHCDCDLLISNIGEFSDTIRDLNRDIAQKSSGAAHFMKVRLKETVAEEVERLEYEYAQRVHQRLSGHAVESAVNPLQGQDVTGRKEDMVLNAAYLIADEYLEAFQMELEKLRDENDGLGFSYELTGPWPPYSFVRIEFEKEVIHE
jgi:hypothetical protein